MNIKLIAIAFITLCALVGTGTHAKKPAAKLWRPTPDDDGGNDDGTSGDGTAPPRPTIAFASGRNPFAVRDMDNANPTPAPTHTNEGLRSGCSSCIVNGCGEGNCDGVMYCGADGGGNYASKCTAACPACPTPAPSGNDDEEDAVRSGRNDRHDMAAMRAAFERVRNNAIVKINQAKAAFKVGCTERTGCDYDYTLMLQKVKKEAFAEAVKVVEAYGHKMGKAALVAHGGPVETGNVLGRFFAEDFGGFEAISLREWAGPEDNEVTGAVKPIPTMSPSGGPASASKLKPWSKLKPTGGLAGKDLGPTGEGSRTAAGKLLGFWSFEPRDRGALVHGVIADDPDDQDFVPFEFTAGRDRVRDFAAPEAGRRYTAPMPAVPLSGGAPKLRGGGSVILEREPEPEGLTGKTDDWYHPAASLKAFKAEPKKLEEGGRDAPKPKPTTSWTTVAGAAGAGVALLALGGVAAWKMRPNRPAAPVPLVGKAAPASFVVAGGSVVGGSNSAAENAAAVTVV